MGHPAVSKDPAVGAADLVFKTSCHLALGTGTGSTPSPAPCQGQVSKGTLSGRDDDGRTFLLPQVSAVDFEVLSKEEPRPQQEWPEGARPSSWRCAPCPEEIPRALTDAGWPRPLQSPEARAGRTSRCRCDIRAPSLLPPGTLPLTALVSCALWAQCRVPGVTATAAGPGPWRDQGSGSGSAWGRLAPKDKRVPAEAGARTSGW